MKRAYLSNLIFIRGQIIEHYLILMIERINSYKSYQSQSKEWNAYENPIIKRLSSSPIQKDSMNSPITEINEFTANNFDQCNSSSTEKETFGFRWVNTIVFTNLFVDLI